VGGIDVGAGAAELLRLLDPAIRPDPYPLLARLREAAPFRMPMVPVTVAASFADCAAVLHDPNASVDRAKATLPIGRSTIRDFLPPDPPAGMEHPSFLFLDPPDHTRLRRLVSKAFTARVVQRLEPRITALVDEAFDRAAERGSLEVVADLAYPLPVTVICQLLGVPLEDEAQFSAWSRTLARALDPVLALTGRRHADFGAQLSAAVEVHHYFESLVQARRAEPSDDLLSALTQAHDAGDQLSTDELISSCVLLLIAGHETTVNLISAGVLALLRNPEQLQALREEPELASGVVEEALRYDPPVQMLARIAASPMQVGDVPVERGDVVLMLLAAAHRDPAAFTDPDRFDPHREARHLAFGMGPHFCLGAPLARLEARLALSHFARRVVEPRLLGDPPPYKDSATLRGPSSMPVAFERIAPA
jgi:cytochrome P450